MPSSSRPRSWLAREWWLLALVYLLALAVRLFFWRTPSYGYEGWIYFIAGHGWQPPANFHDVNGWFASYYNQFSAIALARPMFFLAFAPAANVSFDAYRLAHVLVSALLPALAVVLLRERGVRPWIAYPTGAAVALQTSFVVWGAIGFMDTPMTVWFALGLWAAERRKPFLSGGFLLAAVWTKETAFAGVVALLGLSLLRVWRAGELRKWPLRLDRTQAAYLFVALVGLLPLLVALMQGLVGPGGYGYRNAARVFDLLVLTPWLFIPVLVGLVWPRTRDAAILALVFPAFFLFLYFVGQRAIDLWYVVPSGFLAIVAGAHTIDEAWTRARRAPWARFATLALTALVAGVLFAQPVLASGPGKNAFYNPASDAINDNLEQSLAFERAMDLDLYAALSSLPTRNGTTYLFVDTSLGVLLIRDEGRETWLGYTALVESKSLRTDPWASAIEARVDAVMVAKNANPLNQAIRETYADCSVYDNPWYVILEAKPCQGRGEQLGQAYTRLQAIPAGA